MKELPIQTRREFLRSTFVGGSMCATLPGFVMSTMNQVHADTMDQPKPSGEPVLVLLQLAGGNDGLNTIVPYKNDEYYKARKNIGIAKDKVLKIDDELGMNPELSGLKTLYDEGHLAIVQGVGYPNPNRSHFRSMEIWHTASDPEEFETVGWLGKYFDNQCSGCGPTVGIAFDKTMPQLFWAESPKGIAIQAPKTFKVQSNRNKKMKPEEEFFRELNALGNTGNTSINSKDSSLDFVHRVSLDAQISVDQIQRTVKTYTPKQTYPNNRLANELKTVAQLIGGGMPTRIYFVSQGGYDTHANQMGNHNRLLREYSESLHAFIHDLKDQGNLDRVAVFTFSEFGRRVKENASGGTDHGTAAPVFAAGGLVQPGLYGTHPDLSPDQLDKGDLRYSTDFRSIYAELLEDVLRTSSEPVLGERFKPLDIIRTA